MADCTCEKPAECESSGYITEGNNARRCAIYSAWAKQEALAARMESTRLSPRFRTRTFETFRETKQNRMAVGLCKTWVESYPQDGTGLFIYGPVGTGKTHLAAAVVNALLQLGHVALFAYSPDLLADFRAGIKDGSTEEKIQTAMKAPVLVLDDLGAERATDYAQEVLPRIINRRYEDLLPTICTTNLASSQLADQITARSVSRLTECCMWVELIGADFRRAK
jgi:DNA replication protein DnaC